MCVCVCVCLSDMFCLLSFSSPLSVDDRMSDDFFSSLSLSLSLFWFLLLVLFEKQCKRNKTKIYLGEMKGHGSMRVWS